MWVITMQRRNLIISSLLLLSFSTTIYAAEPDMFSLYASLVDQWKNEVFTCFNEAEKEVYKSVPTPDDVVGPHEDPAKCVCKGTGTIVHGDGHTTPCPFHSREPEPEAEAETITDPPLVKIKKTTCQCETRCACDDCQCAKGEVELLLRRTEEE